MNKVLSIKANNRAQETLLLQLSPKVVKKSENWNKDSVKII